jgi:hypothetical protein
MQLTSQMLPLRLLHRLHPSRQRAQLSERMLPRQNVVQEALDLSRRLMGLQKFLRRDVVGILADNAAINYNGVSTNDTQYELRRKAITVILAEDSDIVIADKVVQLRFVLDYDLRPSATLSGDEMSAGSSRTEANPPQISCAHQIETELFRDVLNPVHILL